MVEGIIKSGLRELFYFSTITPRSLFQLTRDTKIFTHVTHDQL